MRKQAIFLLTLLFVVIGAACQTETEGAVETSENEPIVVMNGDKKLAFEQPPERAISVNQHVTEVMLALGLEEHMIGTAFLDDEIHPDYQEPYENIPVLADHYPSKEIILKEEPDFVYAGWESAFTEDAVGSREDLHAIQIGTYLQESSNMVNPQLEDVFQDIRNIGTIFQVEDRAEALIRDMTEKIEKTKEKIPEQDTPKKVFVYDSGEDAPFTATQNFLNTLITMAEAKNIFGDIEKGWATVSWEGVAEHNPDEIIIIDYGETSVEDKMTFLENHPMMAQLDAVQNKRYTVIPLSVASEGIRVPEAFEKIVDGIYREE